MSTFGSKTPYPCLRKDLEFFPLQHGQQRLVLIRDHLGLVGEGRAVPFDLFELMTMLDGTRSPRDLQMFLVRKKAGLLVSLDEVNKILAHLDESYLLESPRYLEAKEKIVSDFVSSPVRPSSHAGTSYPDNPELLKERIREILALAPQQETTYDKQPVALISPHIDLSVGTRGYASAYKILTRFKPTRVLVLGVGHQMIGALFSLTSKDFETPLGRARTDKDAVRKLLGTDANVLSDNDFPHRGEHSIEFQVIFLQYLLEDSEFSIIPILCGSVWGSLSPCSRESYLQKAGHLLEALKDLVLDKNEVTLVLAGVDLSHIGPKFGHNVPAAHLKSESRSHDQALLHALLEQDAEKFWNESLRINDQYNVCGFSALACMLEILPPFKGHILHYEIWDEPPTQSAVSFCAAALF